MGWNNDGETNNALTADEMIAMSIGPCMGSINEEREHDENRQESRTPCGMAGQRQAQDLQTGSHRQNTGTLGPSFSF